MEKEKKGYAVVLAEVAGFEIRMMMETNGTTMLSEGVIIALVDVKSGKPCMSEDHPGLVLRKRDILSTQEIFSQLREFDLALTKSDLKHALDVAQKALLTAEKAIKYYEEPSLSDVYKRLVDSAYEHIEECDKDGVFIKEKGNALWIRKAMVEKLIKWAGYSKNSTFFAKDMIRLGCLTGKTIFTRNRKDSYWSKTTWDRKSNVEHFRINLVPELLEGGAE